MLIPVGNNAGNRKWAHSYNTRARYGRGGFRRSPALPAPARRNARARPPASARDLCCAVTLFMNQTNNAARSLVIRLDCCSQGLIVDWTQKTARGGVSRRCVSSNCQHIKKYKKKCNAPFIVSRGEILQPGCKKSSFTTPAHHLRRENAVNVFVGP